MSMMRKAVTSRGHRALQAGAVHVALVLAVLLCVSAVRAAAVYMTLSATKTEGANVHVCVGVESGGQKVAGTQNDLVWDAACATLKADSCAAVPDSKKPLHGNAVKDDPARYRALVFALDNVEPVRDGSLYCCDFTLTGGGDSCCAVRFDRLGVSDPVGGTLEVSGNPAQLCLATGAAPAGAAAPPAAPPPAATTTTRGGNQWVWVVLIAIGVVVVAVLILRGRSR